MSASAGGSGKCWKNAQLYELIYLIGDLVEGPGVSQIKAPHPAGPELAPLENGPIPSKTKETSTDKVDEQTSNKKQNKDKPKGDNKSKNEEKIMKHEENKDQGNVKSKSLDEKSAENDGDDIEDSDEIPDLSDAERTGNELELIKARTMYNMVEQIAFEDTAIQLLYLSSMQARVFDSENIHVLVDAFKIPKPQLVIKLLGSKFGSASIRFSQSPDHSHVLEDTWNNLYDLPNALDAERKLTIFMQEYLIPIASLNSAVVFVDLMPDCTLLSAFVTALGNIRARFGKRLPFTIIGVGPELLYHMAARGDIKGAGMYTKRIRNLSARWSANFMQQDVVFNRHKSTFAASKNSRGGEAWFPPFVDHIILVQ
jgi:hypothetical protein